MRHDVPPVPALGSVVDGSEGSKASLQTPPSLWDTRAPMDSLSDSLAKADEALAALAPEGFDLDATCARAIEGLPSGLEALEAALTELGAEPLPPMPEPVVVRSKATEPAATEAPVDETDADDGSGDTDETAAAPEAADVVDGASADAEAEPPSDEIPTGQIDAIEAAAAGTDSESDAEAESAFDALLATPDDEAVDDEPASVEIELSAEESEVTSEPEPEPTAADEEPDAAASSAPGASPSIPAAFQSDDSDLDAAFAHLESTSQMDETPPAEPVAEEIAPAQSEGDEDEATTIFNADMLAAAGLGDGDSAAVEAADADGLSSDTTEEEIFDEDEFELLVDEEILIEDDDDELEAVSVPQPSVPPPPPAAMKSSPPPPPGSASEAPPAAEGEAQEGDVEGEEGEDGEKKGFFRKLFG